MGLPFFDKKNPMGLDKDFEKVLNRDMTIQRLLAKLGLDKWFLLEEKGRVSPMTRERQRFEADVKEQFQELKKKGLSIPVFTL